MPCVAAARTVADAVDLAPLLSLLAGAALPSLLLAAIPAPTLQPQC